MRTRLVKWLCIAVLFVAFILSPWIAEYQLVIRLVVCAGAAVVALQAFRAGRQQWAIGFLVLALLFNPAVPIFALGGSLGIPAIVLAATSFAVSLSLLKSRPLLSIPSITDRTPGSESL